MTRPTHGWLLFKHSLTGWMAFNGVCVCTVCVLACLYVSACVRVSDGCGSASFALSACLPACLCVCRAYLILCIPITAPPTFIGQRSLYTICCLRECVACVCRGASFAYLPSA